VLDTDDRTVRQGEPTGDLSAVPTGAIPMGRGGDGGELMTGVHPRVATAGTRVGGRVDRRQLEEGRSARAGSRADRHSRRRRARRVLIGAVLLAVIAGVIVGGRWLLFSRYWVGFDDDHVAVFRGVPGDVAGLRLSRLVERTAITRAEVPEGYATRLDDGVSATGLQDARRIAACSRDVFNPSGCAGGSSTAPTTSGPTTTTAARATVTTRARATATTKAGG
jgi:hypothetical protein